MEMILPVRCDSVAAGSTPGRPVGDRTLEIMAEIQLADALGRVTAIIELEQFELERFDRFSSKARTAARLCGKKVRARKLPGGRAELTLLSE